MARALEQRAAELDEAGCADNDVEACVSVAMLVGTDEQRRARVKHALRLAIRNCSLGDWVSCEVAVELIERDVPGVEAQAHRLEWLRERGCRLGSPEVRCEVK